MHVVKVLRIVLDTNFEAKINSLQVCFKQSCHELKNVAVCTHCCTKYCREVYMYCLSVKCFLEHIE